MNSYRQGVVAVIQNDRGEILLFERADSLGWQFPQGGVKQGESPEQALMRELEEETGTEKFKILRKGGGTTFYDWPRLTRQTRFVGAEHTWFLCKFIGAGAPNLANTDGTFSQFRWERPEAALAAIVEFKRLPFRKGLQMLGLVGGPSETGIS